MKTSDQTQELVQTALSLLGGGALPKQEDEAIALRREWEQESNRLTTQVDAWLDVCDRECFLTGISAQVAAAALLALLAHGFNEIPAKYRTEMREEVVGYYSVCCSAVDIVEVQPVEVVVSPARREMCRGGDIKRVLKAVAARGVAYTMAVDEWLLALSPHTTASLWATR